MKIVIEVRGGCVCAVYLDDPDAEVMLVDWDYIEEGNETERFPHVAMDQIPASVSGVLLSVFQDGGA